MRERLAPAAAALQRQAKVAERFDRIDVQRQRAFESLLRIGVPPGMEVNMPQRQQWRRPCRLVLRGLVEAPRRGVEIPAREQKRAAIVMRLGKRGRHFEDTAIGGDRVVDAARARFRRATGEELLPSDTWARAHALASTAGVTTACRRHPKRNQPQARKSTTSTSVNASCSAAPVSIPNLDRAASTTRPIPHCTAKLPLNISRLSAVFARAASARGNPCPRSVKPSTLTAAPSPYTVHTTQVHGRRRVISASATMFRPKPAA